MDKAGFREIFDRYFDSLRSYVYYRLADEEAASDIAQDVFMRVWEKRGALDARNIRPLLYKMAGDMVVSHYRRQSVRLDFRRNMPDGGEGLSPNEEVQFRELMGRYSDALAEMPDTQRAVFLMSREEGLKYREIAERLGIGVKAVEKRMTLAIQALKLKLL